MYLGYCLKSVFKLTKKIKDGRVGIIKTKTGTVKTPFFMPIATKGAVKIIEPREIKKIGYELILGNTYHLMLKPGDKLVKKAGGLHKFMNWDGSILTDSGGFQVFSLGEKAKERFGKSGVKLSEKGVSFVNPENGKKLFMSPEDSIQIQLNLGSDIIMCLDECPPYPCSRIQALRSLELTTRWAKRCKEYFDKKTKGLKKKPLLFGIVQGSVYEDLRIKSARQLLELDFDGYAIGGVAVGEPRKKLYDILNWVVPLLPENKPHYLMGLGRPEEVSRAIQKGIDMFDCVIPTREGRHGRIFVWNKKNPTLKDLKDKKFFKTINICNQKYADDFSPLDENCDCLVCKSYSRSYLRHLFNTKEPLGMKLAALHNLYFYQKLIEKFRK